MVKTMRNERQKFSPAGAESEIKDEVVRESRTQPFTVTGSTHVDGDETVLIECDEYPSIHKGTTDRIEKIGWKWSGLTRDSDGTVNLYFRPIGN